MTTTDTEPNSGRLPDSYDRLVPISDLLRDSHNVRDSRPSDTLIQSIRRSGISNALVTREHPEDDDLLMVTDGWQRYQAARELGWSHLPVNVYPNALEALEHAEIQSISDEWTTFQAAKHISSVYEMYKTEQDDEAALQEVASRTARSEQTVRRYLNAFNLPDAAINLLKQRENITGQELRTANNFWDSNIKRYTGRLLSWQVAALAGELRDEFDSDDRLIRTLMRTVPMNADNGRAFVRAVAEGLSFDAARQRVFNCSGDENYWTAPQTEIHLQIEEKAALMEFVSKGERCQSDVVEQQIRSFAKQLTPPEGNSTMDEFN
jgi:ParB-like nuclease domain.